MTVADRWLLPDGVEEVLPKKAKRVEALRRQLLDLYRSWGYDYVIPPLLEFQESLLIGLGHDMERQSFKVTDQLSGRMLALRADITPQTARMDAHSLRRDGTRRLCYAGSVLHTRPKSLMASRTPIEVGAELYGDTGLAGDVEAICLMLETLYAAGVETVHLDLGHVGIFRALSQAADLSAEQEAELFDILQRKAAAELDACLAKMPEQHQNWFNTLAQANGDTAGLLEAKQAFSGVSEAVTAAITELLEVANQVQARYQRVICYFDLAELRGYHYHSGLVFAALVPGQGRAVANGGRYDNVGEVFGRGRPATGFSADLKTLVALSADKQPLAAQGSIYAPQQEADAAFWQLVAQLRADGQRVVAGFDGESIGKEFDRVILKQDGQWQVQALDR